MSNRESDEGWLPWDVPTKKVSARAILSLHGMCLSALIVCRYHRYSVIAMLNEDRVLSPMTSKISVRLYMAIFLNAMVMLVLRTGFPRPFISLCTRHVEHNVDMTSTVHYKPTTHHNNICRQVGGKQDCI
jgi:hypothetical protein